MLPISSNGANVIYQKVVRPYFLKHQNTADEVIDKIADKAKEVVGDAFKKTHWASVHNTTTPPQQQNV